MANEIGHNFTPNKTLYSCRFQLNGNVFIASGASDELWGAGGNDADDYDVAMSEKGGADTSGHYVGAFDPSSNIAAGVYRVTIYHQAGANPADSDKAIGQGIGYWDGTHMINLSSINDDLARLIALQSTVLNVFDETTAGAGGSGGGVDAPAPSSG